MTIGAAVNSACFTAGFEESVVVTINGTGYSVPGIYEAPSSEFNADDLTLIDAAPAVLVKTDDVTGVTARRDTVTRGGTAYKVKKVLHDGTGVTRLELSDD